LTSLLVALTIASTVMTIPDNPCPSGWKYMLAEVRAGERDPTDIARRLMVKPDMLADWNRMSVRERLQQGQLLVFCKDLRPASVGSPSRGRLRAGVNMDADGDSRGCGWVKSPLRTTTWGTPETVAAVSDCLCRFKTRFPGAPDVTLGDLSRQGGGRLGRHLSHRSGRDVDLGYITNPPQSGGYFNRNARYGNLDAEKQWWIVKCFLDRGNVRFIFLNWPALSALKSFVKSRPELSFYMRFFPGGSSPVISADREHRNHLHVRFDCPPDDIECIE